MKQDKNWIEQEASQIVSQLWRGNQEQQVFVTDKVSFLMRNLIKTLRKNYWGVFDEPNDPSAKMDFLKERVGIEVGFGHASFIGIDLLKFQVASYSGLDKIDVGVYIVTTKGFQKGMKEKYNKNWEGSLSFEKVVRYLPHFKSAIQLPIYAIGIDL